MGSVKEREELISSEAAKGEEDNDKAMSDRGGSRSDKNLLAYRLKMKVYLFLGQIPSDEVKYEKIIWG